MSELDVPLTPSTFGTLSMNVWFTGLTDEERQKERDEILQAKLSDIHALAELVQALLDQQHICVVGTKSAIEEHEELFDRKEELIS